MAKKSLIALAVALAGLSRPSVGEFVITRLVHPANPYPVQRAGKSGVAAAKRASRKRKGRLK